MNEKDPLQSLLKTWQAPEPRADFEASVLRRLHSQPEAASFWQRWFAEPLEQAWLLWRQPALATVSVAALALVLAIGTAFLQGRTDGGGGGRLALFRLDVFSPYPGASVTDAYLETVNR